MKCIILRHGCGDESQRSDAETKADFQRMSQLISKPSIVNSERWDDTKVFDTLVQIPYARSYLPLLRQLILQALEAGIPFLPTHAMRIVITEECFTYSIHRSVLAHVNDTLGSDDWFWRALHYQPCCGIKSLDGFEVWSDPEWKNQSSSELHKSAGQACWENRRSLRVVTFRLCSLWLLTSTQETSHTHLASCGCSVIAWIGVYCVGIWGLWTFQCEQIWHRIWENGKWRPCNAHKGVRFASGWWIRLTIAMKHSKLKLIGEERVNIVRVRCWLLALAVVGSSYIKYFLLTLAVVRRARRRRPYVCARSELVLMYIVAIWNCSLLSIDFQNMHMNSNSIRALA